MGLTIKGSGIHKLKLIIIIPLINNMESIQFTNYIVAIILAQTIIKKKLRVCSNKNDIG